MKSSFYLSLIALGFSAPATAQNGAMWVDNAGRRLSMDFSGSGGVPMTAVNQSVADMASLFKTVCLSTDQNALGSVSAAHMTHLGLTAVPFTVLGTRKVAPLTLDIWHGKGAVISQSPGFYAAKFAQCNVLFYPDQLPLRQDVVDALANALGTGPTNAASAIKKSGKPNPAYRPEWMLTSAGTSQILTAHVWEGSPMIPGSRVQISVRAARKTK